MFSYCGECVAGVRDEQNRIPPLHIEFGPRFFPNPTTTIKQKAKLKPISRNPQIHNLYYSNTTKSNFSVENGKKKEKLRMLNIVGIGIWTQPLPLGAATILGLGVFVLTKTLPFTGDGSEHRLGNVHDELVEVRAGWRARVRCMEVTARWRVKGERACAYQDWSINN